jgi:hypothetical protein
MIVPILKTFSGMLRKDMLMIGIGGFTAMSEMKAAKKEGKSGAVNTAKIVASQTFPLLLTAGIKSGMRQMLFWGALQNPGAIYKGITGTFRGLQLSQAEMYRQALPFSHSYQATEQAYNHQQNSLQQIGEVSGLGNEAAMFSARYMNNRY